MKTTIKPFGKAGQYIESMPLSGKPKGIILYFHGLGEVGKGLDVLQEKSELLRLIKNGLEIEYIVISPYLTSGNSWTSAIIKSMFGVIDSYGLNEKHVTGVSLGGIATIAAMNLAYSWRGCPDYFKTAGIVCGRTSISTAEPFKHTNITWWHGDKDTTLPYSLAEKFINMLKEHNHKNAELVTYNGQGHNIWGKAYQEWLEKYIYS